MLSTRKLRSVLRAHETLVYESFQVIQQRDARALYLYTKSAMLHQWELRIRYELEPGILSLPIPVHSFTAYFHHLI